MWNNRFIQHKDYVGLYEVFYNDEGVPCGYAETPEEIGDSPEDIISILEMQLKDAKDGKDSVLQDDDFVGECDFGRMETVSIDELIKDE